MALPETCAHADRTCIGILDAALRKDAPSDLIRVDGRGVRYFIGDSLVGYIRLCRSHHRRYDGAAVGEAKTPEQRSQVSRNGWSESRRAAASERMRGNSHALGYRHTDEARLAIGAASIDRDSAGILNASKRADLG